MEDKYEIDALNIIHNADTEMASDMIATFAKAGFLPSNATALLFCAALFCHTVKTTDPETTTHIMLVFMKLVQLYDEAGEDSEC